MTLKQAMKDAKAKEEYHNIKLHSLSSSHPHLRKHIKTIKGGAVRSSDISHLTNISILDPFGRSNVLISIISKFIQWLAFDVNNYILQYHSLSDGSPFL